MAAVTRADDTIEVVVTDEPTRRVIRLVLWRQAAVAIGDQFDDAIYCFEDASDERYREARGEAATRIHAFQDLAVLVDRVDDASIGDTVRVAYAFAEELAGFRQGIEEGSFWEETPDKRELLLATHAAAMGLADQLPQGAEAVA